MKMEKEHKTKKVLSIYAFLGFFILIVILILTIFYIFDLYMERNLKTKCFDKCLNKELDSRICMDYCDNFKLEKESWDLLFKCQE